MFLLLCTELATQKINFLTFVCAEFSAKLAFCADCPGQRECHVGPAINLSLSLLSMEEVTWMRHTHQDPCSTSWSQHFSTPLSFCHAFLTIFLWKSPTHCSFSSNMIKLLFAALLAGLTRGQQHLRAANTLSTRELQQNVQCTQDQANWSGICAKVDAATSILDHAPNSIGWMPSNEWKLWDGVPVDPSMHTKKRQAWFHLSLVFFTNTF